MNRNCLLLNSISNKKIPNEELDSLDEWNTLITNNNHLLTILHVNICSIGKHWDWLNMKINSILNNLDVLILTEVNVKSEEAKCYQIKKFNQISLCRTGRGGGIIIFVRDTYISETLTYNLDQAENIILHLKHQTYKTQFKLIAIYRSPKLNQQRFIDDLTWWLQNAVKKDDNLVLIGDVNICIHKRNSNNANYLNLLTNYLIIPTINSYTREEMRAGEVQKSCIDHVNLKLGNSLKYVSSVIKEKPSDHWFVACRLSTNNVILSKRRKTYVEIIDKRRAQIEIDKYNWDELCEISDPNILYTKLCKIFSQIHKKSIKVHEKNEKDLATPWVNNSIKKEIELKASLLKQWRNNQNNMIIYETYKKQRNIVTQIIKKEKRRYLFKLFNEAKGDVKKTWSLINDLLHRKIKEPVDKKLKKNFQTDDLTILANEFNKDFLNTIIQLKQENRCNFMPVKEIEHEKQGELTSMYLRQAKEKDINKIIMELNKTGPGIDGIKLEEIRNNRLILTPILTQLINNIISTSTIPTELKISCVTPLYKKGEVDKLSNYRPVGSMPVVEKILEKFLNLQTKKYLSKNNIIPNFQHGFQDKKSTYTLLKDFSELINKALDEQKYIIIIFLDLSSAFSAIEHEILLKKFKEIGICHPVFNNYFQGRKQITKLGQIKSEQEPVNHGLIQGGINSPTWYNIYTYDVKYLDMTSHLKMFADDSCLISIHSDPDVAVRNAQQDFINLQKYFYNNSIFLNNQKTEVMTLGPKKVTPVEIKKIHCHIRTCLENFNQDTCNCASLEYTEKVKYLGIFIDREFKLKGHVQQLCKKLRVLHYNFNKIDADCLPMTTKKTIYFSLVESLLRYGVTVYTVAPGYCLNPLNSIQKRIQKLLFKEKRDQLQLMTPNQLSNFISICDNFYDDQFRKTIHVEYNLRHKQKYERHFPRNKFGERTLGYKIPFLLDQYCTEFLEEKNINIVKKKLKLKLIDS